MVLLCHGFQCFELTSVLFSGFQLFLLVCTAIFNGSLCSSVHNGFLCFYSTCARKLSIHYIMDNGVSNREHVTVFVLTNRAALNSSLFSRQADIGIRP